MQYKKYHRNDGIDKLNFKILQEVDNYNIKNIEINSTMLANSILVSRTTIIFRIKNLISRTLMEYVYSGKKRLFHLTSFGKTILYSENNKESEVRLLEGFHSIVEIFESIVRGESKNKIYAIEPYGQYKYFLDKINQDNIQLKMLQTLELFKKNLYISECITSDRILLELQKLPLNILKEMVGRHTSLHIIPDEKLTFKDYILIDKNKVYFIDILSEKVIIIDSIHFSNTMIQIFKNLKTMSMPIDLNSKIHSLIKKY